jgi:hypothetical protein
MDQTTLAVLLGDIAQVVSIIVAASMVVFLVRREAAEALKVSRQQIYQALELGSIRLFRFECENPELIAALWYPTERRLGQSGSKLVSDYQLRAYICQILNLFEMAVRFRRDDVFTHEIFASWIIWMWELCCEPVFQKIWEAGVKRNYIPIFCEIMTAGIKLCNERGADEEKQTKFSKEIAKIMNDKNYKVSWPG